jgi:hypothetical protein
MVEVTEGVLPSGRLCQYVPLAMSSLPSEVGVETMGC